MTATGNDSTRRRVLFVAEAVTLAHVGRLLALAGHLDPARYDVLLAADPRYTSVIGAPAVPVRAIHTIPGAQFFAALDKGRPIYHSRDLLQYVEEDRALIRDFKPEVVVGDFRLSLSASARLERVPYITVTNAYWSPYARVRYLVPDMTLTRVAGVTLAQKLFDLARPFAFAQHAAPVNAMRRHFELKPLGGDLRVAYTDADYTLYADVPEMVPMNPLPERHEFIGPVPWAPPLPLPDWWTSVASDRPIVYVNLGSSGPGRWLPHVLRAIGSLPVTVIAATAGRRDAVDAPPNAHVAAFLPGDQAAARASVVVCNGGSPACYQALAAGKPILGLPANLDQFLNMSLVERAGAGILMRYGTRFDREFPEAVERILKEPAYARGAVAARAWIQQHDPHKLFDAALQRILAS